MHKLVDYFGAITIPGRFWLIFNRRGDRKEGGTFVASEIPDGVDRPSFGRRRHPGVSHHRLSPHPSLSRPNANDSRDGRDSHPRDIQVAMTRSLPRYCSRRDIRQHLSLARPFLPRSLGSPILDC